MKKRNEWEDLLLDPFVANTTEVGGLRDLLHVRRIHA